MSLFIPGFSPPWFVAHEPNQLFGICNPEAASVEL